MAITNRESDTGDCDVSVGPDSSKTKTEEAKPSFAKRIKNVFGLVSVEPLLACYIMPSVLAALAVQNLNLEKSCRVNNGYGSNICDRLIRQDVENLTEEVQHVQTLVANMISWKSPLQTCIPALMIMFIGAWSDRTGLRRPCMMMPLVGEIISSLGLLLCTFYFLEWPMEVTGVFEALPPALTGGWTTMFMSVFCYISDHTTVEDKTFRIGVVNIFISVGIPIGTALSGILTKTLGFYGVFSISLFLYAVGFTYGLFCIKDTRRVQESKEKMNFCLDFFNPKHVTDTLKVAFKPRPGTRRCRVMLLMVIFITLTGPVYGEIGVIYLFTRYKFNFNEVDFSLFTTYGVIMNLIGTIIAMTVFTRYFKMDDALLGMLAGVSKLAACIVYSVAPTRSWFHMGQVIECFSGIGVIAMRSIATKLVEPGETGRIHSLFGVVEAIVPIIYSPLYNQVYIRTINSTPGAIFLMGAVLTIPVVVIFLSMYILQKRDDKEIQNAEEMKNVKDFNHKEKYAYTNEITAM